MENKNSQVGGERLSKFTCGNCGSRVAFVSDEGAFFCPECGRKYPLIGELNQRLVGGFDEDGANKVKARIEAKGGVVRIHHSDRGHTWWVYEVLEALNDAR